MRRQQQQQQGQQPSRRLPSSTSASQSQQDDAASGGSSNNMTAQEADDRAKHLEQQLALLEATDPAKAGGAGAANSNHHKASKSDQANALRVQICELLADLVLTDPVFASRNNVMERMWRKCFYVRIAHLRSKLARRRRGGPSGATPTSSGGRRAGGGDPSASSIATLEQHLVVFLGEAITLYDYLVEKLQEKLVGWAPPSRTRADDKEDDDEDDDNNNNSEPQARAAVECLHRLYICLGDLHRYTATAAPANNRGAERSYLLAARLGPGMGHPANQLGVMCGSQILASPSSSRSASSSSGPHSQNQSAVGLYWYARSLLASHEPFETTSVNLQRLFQANQLWLERNQPAPSYADAAAGSTTAVTSSKSVQASLFLARYVKFHGQLLAGGDDAHAHADSGADAAAATKDAMDGVMDGLASLLKQSALSDSLLVKAVTIQAFTESYGASARNRDAIPRTVSLGGRQGTTASDPHSAFARRRLWGRVSTLRMGTMVADRVLSTLQQRSQQQQQVNQQYHSGSTAPAASVPSIRLLLPLLLLAEYVRHSTADLESTVCRAEVTSYLRETYWSCSQDFWERVAQVLDLMGRVVPAEVLAAAPASRGADASSSATLLPAEYLSLRGYTPFAPFIAQGKGSGFLSPRHALQVLREDKAPAASSSAPPTQDTAPAAVSGTSLANKPSPEANRIKLVSRMLTIGHELARDDSSDALRGFRRSVDGRFVYEAPVFEVSKPRDGMDETDDNNKVEDYAEEEDDGGDTVNAFMDDDPVVVQDDMAVAGDDSNSVLVYKSGKVGGPALLMPGAMLANAATVEDPIQDPSLLPHATTPLAPPLPMGTAGVDLGWLNGPNAEVSTGSRQSDRGNDPMEIDPANAFGRFQPPAPQPPAALEDQFLGAIAASATAAPSVNDGAQPSTVLPPPGFGSLARSFALDDAPLPTLAQQQFSLLEASSQLFGTPPPTANPFATMPPSYAFPQQPPQVSAPSHYPQPMFLQHNGDALWMVNDVLGEDAGFETSLLDSGLLNSLLNDDTAATTKNPFAT